MRGTFHSELENYNKHYDADIKLAFVLQLNMRTNQLKTQLWDIGQ